MSGDLSTAEFAKAWAKTLTPWQREALRCIQAGIPVMWPRRSGKSYIRDYILNMNRIPHGNKPLIHNGRKAQK